MVELNRLMELWEKSNRKIMAQCDTVFDTLPNEFRFELVNFMMLQSQLVFRLTQKLKEESDDQPE